MTWIVGRYLITGGSGFIGSNLVAELLTRHQQVRVLDNFSTGRRSNLASFGDRIDIIEGDIRSYHIVAEAMKNVDYVLHQAALPSVPRSVRDPITSNEVNVLGTLNVLQAARDAKVKRLVYASSSSIYGDTPVLPKNESMTPCPLSPYAISKLAGELYCQSFWRLYSFETVCLRYFNVYGPRQDPTSQYSAVIPRFIQAILQDRPLIVYGDGLQSRDFSYVSNVVEANLLACTAQNAPGKVVNIACSERHSILDVIKMLEQIVQRRAKITHGVSRPGDVLHSQADISAAREVLGFVPVVDFAEGLRRTVEFVREAGMQSAV